MRKLSATAALTCAALAAGMASAAAWSASYDVGPSESQGSYDQYYDYYAAPPTHYHARHYRGERVQSR